MAMGRQVGRAKRTRYSSAKRCRDVDTAFVGLSFKEGMEALDSRTKSGALIDEIVCGLAGIECWRTNLVDDVLVDETGRGRKPTQREVTESFPRFEARVRKRHPRVVVALGATTAKHVLWQMAGARFTGWSGSLQYEVVQSDGIAYIAAHHPSHIAVYRRRERDDYIGSLRAVISGALSGLPLPFGAAV